MKFFNATKPVGTSAVGVFFILFGALFEPFVAPADAGLGRIVPRLVLGGVLVAIGLLYLVKASGPT